MKITWNIPLYTKAQSGFVGTRSAQETREVPISTAAKFVSPRSIYGAVSPFQCRAPICKYGEHFLTPGWAEDEELSLFSLNGTESGGRGCFIVARKNKLPPSFHSVHPVIKCHFLPSIRCWGNLFCRAVFAAIKALYFLSMHDNT